MSLAFPGLCADCACSRVVNSGRSIFYLCERALTDPRFRKYPVLPVVTCPGYQRQAPPEPTDDPDPGDKLAG